MAIKKIQPEGRFPFLTYISDRGGVGHIRTLLPSLLMGAWRYKKMSFEPGTLAHFVPDPSFYKAQAFVKFQRSATKDQLQTFEYFSDKIRRQTKTPMIYECDDLLFHIPKSNFASDYYEKNEPYIKKMLKMVDGITVSTPFLKKKYKKYNKNISVVKNRLAKCLWGDIKQCDDHKHEKLKIVYPGSQNHFAIKGHTEKGGDFGDELLKYIIDTKKNKYEWVFVGGIPEELRGDEDITYFPWIDYMLYPHFMKNQNFDIGIAPLEINDFNRCKSDLKMLEYCVCGIPGVYTDITPYQKATIKGKNENEIIKRIEFLSDSFYNRKNAWDDDVFEIKKDLFFEDNRKKWINEHLKLFGQRVE